jgi:hypothetical protein
MVLRRLLLPRIRCPFRGPLRVVSGSVLDSLFLPSSAARSRSSGSPDLWRYRQAAMARANRAVLDAGRIAEAAGRGSRQ